MPFRPEEIIVHDDLRLAYESWETLAGQGRQPAKAVRKSLQLALTRLRLDAQWGEVVRQDMIPAHFREQYGVSNLYCVDLRPFTGRSTRSLTER